MYVFVLYTNTIQIALCSEGDMFTGRIVYLSSQNNQGNMRNVASFMFQLILHFQVSTRYKHIFSSSGYE